MPAIQSSVSIGANATNDNILSGNQYEFSNGYYAMELGLVAAATGLEVDVLVGGEAVGTRLLPSTQNRFPIYPDDFTFRFGMIPGDRLVVRARNTTGAAIVLFYAAKFNRVR